jgi:hypothetical protein
MNPRRIAMGPPRHGDPAGGRDHRQARPRRPSRCAAAPSEAQRDVGRAAEAGPRQSDVTEEPLEREASGVDGEREILRRAVEPRDRERPVEIAAVESRPFDVAERPPLPPSRAPTRR